MAGVVDAEEARSTLKMVETGLVRTSLRRSVAVSSHLVLHLADGEC